MTGESGTRVARRRSVLDPLDAQLAELREELPGWDVWYVYRAREHGGTVWCARPKPLLNCASPDELRAETRQADEQRLAELAAQAAGHDGSPAGAPEGGTPPGESELPRRRPDGPP